MVEYCIRNYNLIFLQTKIDLSSEKRNLTTPHRSPVSPDIPKDVISMLKISLYSNGSDPLKTPSNQAHGTVTVIPATQKTKTGEWLEPEASSQFVEQSKTAFQSKVLLADASWAFKCDCLN